MIPIIDDLYKTATGFTDKNNTHWFDATTVIKCALKYKGSTHEVLRRVDPKHKKLVGYEELKKIGGRIEKCRDTPHTYPRNFISIPGICYLLLTSRDARHKKFSEWVAYKVVPNIIKKGIFINNKKMSIKNNNSIFNKLKKYILRKKYEG